MHRLLVLQIDSTTLSNIIKRKYLRSIDLLYYKTQYEQDTQHCSEQAKMIQEKPTNCGTRAADVLTIFLAGKL